MKTLKTLVIAAAVAVIGLIAYAYSGLHDVRASARHSAVVEWLLETTSDASIGRQARGIEVPDLEDETMILAGINDFNSMCAGCHGAPGRDPDAIGQGLNPPAPDLAREAAEMTAAELFWVTKHGIRMTGMPAWGATHDDDSIWPVVAFMSRLPGIDAEVYERMLADARGRGHHAGEAAAGQDHDHATSAGSSGGSVHVHGDGSEHVHEPATESGAPAEQRPRGQNELRR